MEIQLTEKEKNVMEFLRAKLAKSFGVTVVNNYLTLRFTNDDGEFCTVSSQVVNIDTGGDDYDPECVFCGIEHDVKYVGLNGSEHLRVPVCGDCYCPK